MEGSSRKKGEAKKKFENKVVSTILSYEVTELGRSSFFGSCSRWSFSRTSRSHQNDELERINQKKFESIFLQNLL